MTLLPLCIPENAAEVRRIVKDLEARITELEELAFRAYCEGYELGHHDTVEGAYTPPREYPEEWPEKLAALLEDEK